MVMGEKCPPRPAQFPLRPIDIHDNDPLPGVAVAVPGFTEHGVNAAAGIQADEVQGNIGQGEACAAVCPVEGAGGRRAIPVRGSGCTIGEVSTPLETVDGMLVTNGCVVDGEKEGKIGDDAVIVVSVQFGAFAGQGGRVKCLNAPHSNKGIDCQADGHGDSLNEA